MVKTLQLKTLFIVCLLFAAACAPSTPTPHVSVSGFTDPDKGLTAAVRQAQGTMYILRQALLAPRPSYASLRVKVRFISNGNIEDMWTEPVDFLDDTCTVRMIEGVTLDAGAHPDRLVEVPSKDLLDWMILEKDGTVLGGYTLKLDFKRMTPKQQKEYLKATGYKFQ